MSTDLPRTPCPRTRARLEQPSPGLCRGLKEAQCSRSHMTAGHPLASCPGKGQATGWIERAETQPRRSYVALGSLEAPPGACKLSPTPFSLLSALLKSEVSCVGRV